MKKLGDLGVLTVVLGLLLAGAGAGTLAAAASPVQEPSAVEPSRVAPL